MEQREDLKLEIWIAEKMSSRKNGLGYFINIHLICARPAAGQQAVGTRAWLRWWHHGDTVTIYKGTVTTGASNESLRRFHNHRERPYWGLLLVEMPTSASTSKNLLGHYAKQALTHSK